MRRISLSNSGATNSSATTKLQTYMANSLIRSPSKIMRKKSSTAPLTLSRCGSRMSFTNRVSFRMLILQLPVSLSNLARPRASSPTLSPSRLKPTARRELEMVPKECRELCSSMSSERGYSILRSSWSMQHRSHSDHSLST